MATDAIRYAVLGLVAARTDGIHGYQIKSELDGEIWALNHGQVYRALERLRAAGLIEGFEQPQSGRPNRKVFRITARGERVLGRWLLRPPSEELPALHDEVSLKLLLLAEDRAQAILRLVRDHRARLRQRLARLERRRDRLDDESLVQELLLRRADMRLRSELDWLAMVEEAVASRDGAATAEASV
jgi:DNA-binding PadR family transcriptional regulator